VRYRQWLGIEPAAARRSVAPGDPSTITPRAGRWHDFEFSSFPRGTVNDQARRRGRMKFIRIGDEILRLDLITHIKEGAKDETLYGRSVRKTTDHRYGWLEVHFVSGDVLKIEGEAADVFRRVLEDELKIRDLAATPHVPPRKAVPHEGHAPAAEPATATARHDHAPRPAEEHRPGLRNGFGR
jgi:hypothetical protein